MPTNPRPLLDKLADPFTMFPVEDVADTVFVAVEETETRKTERMGWWGVARKSRSVEDEHDHEKIGLLIGALFVLGQAAITQTESILNELRKYPEAERLIPAGKLEKLLKHAAEETNTKLSKLVLITSVSNYFKHAPAWPKDWNVVARNGTSKEAETIFHVRKIGMSPESEMTDNLLLAAKKGSRLDLTTRRGDACPNFRSAAPPTSRPRPLPSPLCAEDPSFRLSPDWPVSRNTIGCRPGSTSGDRPSCGCIGGSGFVTIT
jgi:hypothetical protein